MINHSIKVETDWELPQELISMEVSEIISETDISIPDELSGKGSLEESIEDRIDTVIEEELEKACFKCNMVKMFDSQTEEFYCPMCNDE